MILLNLSGAIGLYLLHYCALCTFGSRNTRILLHLDLDRRGVHSRGHRTIRQVFEDALARQRCTRNRTAFHDSIRGTCQKYHMASE